MTQQTEYVLRARDPETEYMLRILGYVLSGRPRLAQAELSDMVDALAVLPPDCPKVQTIFTQAHFSKRHQLELVLADLE